MEKDTNLMEKSTILYINQNRQNNFDILIGKGFAEAFSWHKHFKRIIFICYSSTNEYLYRKVSENYYIIGIPFELSSSTFKSIISIGKNYLKLFFFLARLTKILEINIIRIENLLISGPSVYLISKIRKIPYIMWLGGSERKSLIIKYQKNLITWVLDKIIILYEKIILKNANFVFAVTNNLFELAKKRNVKNKFLSPNYVNLSIFNDIHSKDSISSNKKIQVLYVGRFEEEKGIKVLLNAIKILSDEGEKVEFNLVGNGSLKPWITTFIKENKLKNVKLPGIFDYEEMPKIYNMADIFVLPSFTEGSPASLIEAMSCGTASICTAVGECKNLIHDGVNGLLVPVGDPNQLSKAIEHLIHNKELITNFRENSRNLILKYTKNYLKIHKFVYEQLLKLYNKRIFN